MEEEWRVYLKENAPELYEEMRSSLKHMWEWRYKAGMLRAAEIAESDTEATFKFAPEKLIADAIREEANNEQG